ncbi:CpaD family pilus assembly protein [Bosea sp. (in: a-proteobacteria)]|uniref:CpaD family pilus assembly protein n=1 Tax=Bosea sp. (in: a-proteobacteria) TaxID=1871050 RepID=UPI00260AB788|nr:CpaD family pilus assembly protein [Bosea sp. (in: a-proteobacteria)]MCO5090251.1 CpaD family pilus assembly protein [Bosea sp. (in: a-proteobacteria)]
MTVSSRNVTLAPRLTAAVLALGALLGGCANRSTGGDTLAFGADDVRERHPIVLRDAPRSLDVFVGRAGGALDPRQAEDVASFAREFRRSGKGGLVAEVPTGARRDYATQDTLNGIRTALTRGGVSPAVLSVRSYPVQDPGLASPIRLTFASLQASVPHDCGQWPTDLGSSNFRFSSSNAPYWNFGCASQATLAAQIADPIDLVRSRDEGRSDIVKRMNAIAKIREGKDPSTEYRQQTPQINSTVGGR